jgi:hypothetical protein
MRYINYGRRKSRNAVQLASAYVARGVCWLPDSGGGVSLHSQYASLLKKGRAKPTLVWLKMGIEAACCLVLYWCLSVYLKDVVGCIAYLVTTVSWHPVD